MRGAREFTALAVIAGVLWSGRRGDLATPIAFCDRELRDDQKFALTSVKEEFVAAECGDLHASRVRSPDTASPQDRISRISDAVFHHGVDIRSIRDVIERI